MFDAFKGYQPDTPASIYDVQRRQQLAQTLLGNRVQNGSQFGAIADALAGTLSGFENTQAANESQAGYSGANQALGDALSGTMDPSKLIQAGGNPFLPQSESGLVGDLIRRKMGIGETFYGTPQISYDDASDPQHQHPVYSIIGSLGTVKKITPPPGGGASFSPNVHYLDTGTGYQGVTNAGGELAGPPITKDLAQAAFNTEWGKALGTDWANAPANLQKEGNLVQTQIAEHKLVDGKVDAAISQIEANPNWMTGMVGDLLSAAKGTPQYDLGQTLNTIKANIGFDTLQNMRNNSQTGGALGQISDMEEKLLQAVNGSLEPGQSAKQLAANLKDIKQRMADLTAAKQAAMVQDIQRYKAGPQAAPTLGAPSPNIGAGTQTAGAPPPKVINGVTYTQDANGDWYAN